MSSHEAQHEETRRPAALPGARRPVGEQAPVLLVSGDEAWLDLVEATLLDASINCQAVRSAANARLALAAHGYDVAVIDTRLPDGAGLDLLPIASRRGVGAILASRRGRVEDAVTAMQGGALDYFIGSVNPTDLVRRVDAAMGRARSAREARRRVRRLKRACRRLTSDRHSVVRQVDSLCTDLVQAYQELADQMNQVTTAAEFSSLIRQELDIESLLRTTLEFTLARSGPTNAAIFLPTTTGDYSLGAYVNYDCPKETCDILLDHLANAVAPRFEACGQVKHLRTAAEFEQFIGDDADWLADSEVLALACEHEEETLAILMLFRDRRNGFVEPLPEQLQTIGTLFAGQLARVIKVHHRHLPKHKWGALGDPEDDRGDDYGDLAA